MSIFQLVKNIFAFDKYDLGTLVYACTPTRKHPVRVVDGDIILIDRNDVGVVIGYSRDGFGELHYRVIMNNQVLSIEDYYLKRLM